jgi:peroxiredoxin
MSLTASTMLSLGTKAPGFSLPDTRGKSVSLADFDEARALVVIFMCNHCPFVKHIVDDLVRFVRSYQGKDVAFVAINSNDVDNYAEDRPERMAELAKQKGFTFPYLYDATQEVAKSYRAACTPDFFIFDSDRRLVYRGQFDESRPGNDVPIAGSDLKAALDALLAGERVPEEQKPSMGCNIKWRAGNEPEYF